jgi:hypothetical protein
MSGLDKGLRRVASDVTGSTSTKTLMNAVCLYQLKYSFMAIPPSQCGKMSRTFLAAGSVVRRSRVANLTAALPSGSFGLSIVHLATPVRQLLSLEGASANKGWID